MADRLAGLMRFLPVPLVLWLFVRAPLGVVTSLVLGTVIMATHRFYARPFSLARAGRCCLWCGGPAGAGPEVEIVDPLGRASYRACSADHLARVGGLLGWAANHVMLLKVGILGTLAAFLAASLAAGGGLLRVDHADLSFGFRLLIALTVLPLGWLGGAQRLAPAGPLHAPLPVHIQALVGSATVVWLFRLVGLLWLAQALAAAVNR